MSDAATIIESLLRQHTPVAFQALGPSMNPTIRDGQCVHVLPLNGVFLKPGCVALYTIHGRMAIHRLIRQDARTGKIFVAADAALEGGDWVPGADILGVVQSVIRAGRSVRLDTRRARWAGLLRHFMRPLRRTALVLLKRQAS